MKNEFVLAFNEVLEEKQLPKDVVLDALEAAMVSAYRRAVNASNAQHVEAKVDIETGKVAIYAEKEIVETVEDQRTEVSIKDASRIDTEAKLGGMIVVETTPRNFGRVAAQTARQVIQQRIREAERDAQLTHYSKQLGEIVSGVVQAVNSQAVTLGLDMKAEGVMPRNQQVPGERFRVHDRVRSLLLEVKSTSRGPQIILSRSHRNFLRRLLENEVPEIYHGMVEIRSIAREPGQRSKVAVAALQPGVDPVGACVGIRGVRIQAIVRELNDEKIDVIEWSQDPAVYIAKALSPARVTGVYLNEHAKGAKTATVVVPEDQLSLAIGRDGQNARLAAKLTSWRIDIKSLPEAATDALYKLQNDPEYAALAVQEVEVIQQVEVALAKKAEGRPVTPEEYQVLSQFVDRVERGLIRQRQKEKQVEEERQRVAQADVPEEAFTIPVEELGLPIRISSLLGGAGYTTAGDLLLQMRLDPDAILGLSGVGAKTIEDIEAALARFTAPAEAIEEQPAVDTAAEAEAVSEVEAALPEVEAVAQETTPQEAVETTPELVLAEAEEPAEAAEAVASVEAGAAEPVAEEAIATASVATEAVVAEAAAEEARVSEAAPEMVSAEAKAEAVEAAAPAEVTEGVEEELPESLDEIFSLRPDVLEQVEPLEEEEDEDEDDSSKKKKKKKKKKFVEVEYDPESDVMVVKKKRKRGGAAWNDEWEL
jgi:N utilization substance protein A